MRDSYTNRNHCPSHKMWSYERDGRWRGWSFVRGSTVYQSLGYVDIITAMNNPKIIYRKIYGILLKKNEVVLLKS